jgi:hypothetical protein
MAETLLMMNKNYNRLLPQTIQLQPPIYDIPVTADVISPWVDKKTAVGYELQFPDRYQCLSLVW